MKQKRNQATLRAFINELMKGQTEEELATAEDRFRAYLTLAETIQQGIGNQKNQT
jgi:hypothetical protein